jgi:hypothetical protein
MIDALKSCHDKEEENFIVNGTYWCYTNLIDILFGNNTSNYIITKTNHNQTLDYVYMIARMVIVLTTLIWISVVVYYFVFYHLGRPSDQMILQ